MKTPNLKIVLVVALLGVAVFLLYRQTAGKPSAIPAEAQQVIQAARQQGGTSSAELSDVRRGAGSGVALDLEADREAEVVDQAVQKEPPASDKSPTQNRKKPRRRARRKSPSGPDEQADHDEAGPTAAPAKPVS